MNNRTSRQQFVAQTLQSNLSAKDKESKHVQMLLNQYIEGEIPVEEIYKQIRDCE